MFGAISFYPGALFTFPKAFPVLGGLPFTGAIADLNVALLFILGVASVGVSGIVLGGWSSNSKYPLLGGLRSAAQIVSYEVPLTLSLMAPVLLAGSLNFNELVRRTARSCPLWGAVPLFIGFFLSSPAASPRRTTLPFDMPEAENELVAGFHTEYSGMRFALFYLALMHQHDGGGGPGQRLLPGRGPSCCPSACTA